MRIRTLRYWDIVVKQETQSHDNLFFEISEFDKENKMRHNTTVVPLEALPELIAYLQRRLKISKSRGNFPPT